MFEIGTFEQLSYFPFSMEYIFVYIISKLSLIWSLLITLKTSAFYLPMGFKKNIIGEICVLCFKETPLQNVPLLEWSFIELMRCLTEDGICLKHYGTVRKM